MESTRFDTLKFSKRAMTVGFTQQQAEFHANEMADLLNSTLVTKVYLKQELARLESRMRSFHYQISGTILGGIATLVTILESVFHFLWR